MKQYHWLSSRIFKGPHKLHYIAAQLSLDLCDWKPKGIKYIKIPLSKYRLRWYV